MVRKNVTLEHHALCKAIALASEKSVAAAVLKTPARAPLLDILCADIERECKKGYSPLSQFNMHCFSLSKTSCYLLNHAPLLIKFLSQCVKLKNKMSIDELL